MEAINEGLEGRKEGGATKDVTWLQQGCGMAAARMRNGCSLGCDMAAPGMQSWKKDVSFTYFGPHASPSQPFFILMNSCIQSWAVASTFHPSCIHIVASILHPKLIPCILTRGVSFWIVEYTFWCLFSFLEKQPIGLSTPLESAWSKTAPTPTSLASTATLNALSKSGATSTGPLAKTAFSLSKAFWHISDHTYVVFFFKRLVKVPQVHYNLHKTFDKSQTCQGISLIPPCLMALGNPGWLALWPDVAIHALHQPHALGMQQLLWQTRSHFFKLTTRLACTKRSNNALKCFMCSSQVLLYVITWSTHAFQLAKLASTWIVHWHWKLSAAFF